MENSTTLCLPTSARAGKPLPHRMMAEGSTRYNEREEDGERDVESDTNAEAENPYDTVQNQLAGYQRSSFPDESEEDEESNESACIEDGVFEKDTPRKGQYQVQFGYPDHSYTRWEVFVNPDGPSQVDPAKACSSRGGSLLGTIDQVFHVVHPGTIIRQAGKCLL